MNRAREQLQHSPPPHEVLYQGLVNRVRKDAELQKNGGTLVKEEERVAHYADQTYIFLLNQSGLNYRVAKNTLDLVKTRREKQLAGKKIGASTSQMVKTIEEGILSRLRFDTFSDFIDVVTDVDVSDLTLKELKDRAIHVKKLEEKRLGQKLDVYETASIPKEEVEDERTNEQLAWKIALQTAAITPHKSVGKDKTQEIIDDLLIQSNSNFNGALSILLESQKIIDDTFDTPEETASLQELSKTLSSMKQRIELRMAEDLFKKKPDSEIIPDVATALDNGINQTTLALQVGSTPVEITPDETAFDRALAVQTQVEEARITALTQEAETQPVNFTKPMVTRTENAPPPPTIPQELRKALAANNKTQSLFDRIIMSRKLKRIPWIPAAISLGALAIWVLYNGLPDINVPTFAQNPNPTGTPTAIYIPQGVAELPTGLSTPSSPKPKTSETRAAIPVATKAQIPLKTGASPTEQLKRPSVVSQPGLHPEKTEAEYRKIQEIRDSLIKGNLTMKIPNYTTHFNGIAIEDPKNGEMKPDQNNFNAPVVTLKLHEDNEGHVVWPKPEDPILKKAVGFYDIGQVKGENGELIAVDGDIAVVAHNINHVIALPMYSNNLSISFSGIKPGDKIELNTGVYRVRFTDPEVNIHTTTFADILSNHSTMKKGTRLILIGCKDGTSIIDSNLDEPRIVVYAELEE